MAQLFKKGELLKLSQGILQNSIKEYKRFCYDGDQVIAEYDSNDTLLRKFVYGPGIDEPIMMIAVNGETETRYYYHFDGLGSVVALSGENGSIVETYSYDVFGEPNRTSDVNNPYFFTGRRLDEETDNYYYRARYYSPKIGRFMQPDPIAYFDGLNLYRYVSNNPVNFVDPRGTKCQDASNSPEVKNCLKKLSECMKNDPIKDDIDRASRGHGVRIQVCNDPKDLGEDTSGDYSWRPWPFRDRIRLEKNFHCSTLLHEISHFEDGYWGRWRPGKSEKKAEEYSDEKYYDNCCE